MEFTLDEVSRFIDKTTSGNRTITIYRAEFTNFQEEYCYPENDNGDSLFTETGTWYFFSGNWAISCTPVEKLVKKGGLQLNIGDWTGESWKIVDFSPYEMTLENGVCYTGCYYKYKRRLVFEKCK